MTKDQKYSVDYVRHIVGENIARLLKEQNMTRAQLAERVYVCDKTVDRYIHGGITFDSLCQVAMALNVNPQDLLVNHEEVPSMFGTKNSSPAHHGGGFLRGL